MKLGTWISGGGSLRVAAGTPDQVQHEGMAGELRGVGEELDVQ